MSDLSNYDIIYKFLKFINILYIIKILSHMKEWICHDWLHRTNPERFSAGIQSGQLEHLTDFLTRELSVLGKKSKFRCSRLTLETVSKRIVRNWTSENNVNKFWFFQARSRLDNFLATSRNFESEIASSRKFWEEPLGQSMLEDARDLTVQKLDQDVKFGLLSEIIDEFKSYNAPVSHFFIAEIFDNVEIKIIKSMKFQIYQYF